LISSGKAAHAYLGVELGSNGAKARVVSVRTGTPAAKAALRAGDVIVSLGGAKIATSDDLRAAINSRKPGDHVSVTYMRNGNRHTVSVTLASRPS
jgi:putative serine protease PepD